MEIILLDKVKGLGNLGDKVIVKPGYGRNFLIPQKKAVIANKANLARFEARLDKIKEAQKQALALAKKRAEKLQDLNLTIPCIASDEGKLYGSISAKEIVATIAQTDENINKREIILTTPIRQIGEYSVKLQLHQDVQVMIKVTITASKQ